MMPVREVLEEEVCALLSRARDVRKTPELVGRLQ